MYLPIGDALSLFFNEGSHDSLPTDIHLLNCVLKAFVRNPFEIWEEVSPINLNRPFHWVDHQDFKYLFPRKSGFELLNVYRLHIVAKNL